VPLPITTAPVLGLLDSSVEANLPVVAPEKSPDIARLVTPVNVPASVTPAPNVARRLAPSRTNAGVTTFASLLVMKVSEAFPVLPAMIVRPADAPVIFAEAPLKKSSASRPFFALIPRLVLLV
jgi:hypothetical protein